MRLIFLCLALFIFACSNPGKKHHESSAKFKYCGTAVEKYCNVDSTPYYKRITGRQMLLTHRMITSLEREGVPDSDTVNYNTKDGINFILKEDQSYVFGKDSGSYTLREYSTLYLSFPGADQCRKEEFFGWFVLCRLTEKGINFEHVWADDERYRCVWRFEFLDP